MHNDYSLGVFILFQIEFCSNSSFPKNHLPEQSEKSIRENDNSAKIQFGKMIIRTKYQFGKNKFMQRRTREKIRASEVLPCKILLELK